MSLSDYLTAAIGAVLGSLGHIFLNWYKQRGQVKLAANEQAYQAYKSMVESLQQTVNQLTANIRDIEKAHLDEMRVLEKENSEFRAKVAALEAKVDVLGTVQPAIKAILDKADLILARLPPIIATK